MIVKDDFVYFEDSDNPEQIITFIQKQTEENNLLEYITSDLKSLIENVNSSKLTEKNKNDIKSIIYSDLEPHQDKEMMLNNRHICTLISLIDYIVRNKHEYPHSMTLEKENTKFQGVFSDSFWELSYFMYDPMFEFYLDSGNEKSLKFNNFNTDIRYILKYFLSGCEVEDFDKNIKNYRKQKKKITN